MNDLARLIMGSIDLEPGFMDEDRKDAARLLDTCSLVLTDGFSEAVVRQDYAEHLREREQIAEHSLDGVR